MRINFLNFRNFIYFLLLLIFFNSCKYANHQINEYPSEKWDKNKKINIALVLSGAGSKVLNDNYPDRRIDSFKNLTLDYCFFIVNLYKSSFLFFILIPPKSLISSSDFTSFLLSPLRNSSLKSSNMINMKFFRIFTYQLV